MAKLINWTARRAGGRITIVGADSETKQPTKVVGIDTITKSLDGSRVVATDKNSVEYELV